MLARVYALALLVAVTLSSAWTPGFLAFFPFLVPVAFLIPGRRYGFDVVAVTFVMVALLAAVSAVVTGANLGYALLWIGLTGLYWVGRYRLPEVLPPAITLRSIAFIACTVAALAFYQVAASTTFGSPYVAYETQMQLGLTASGESLVQRPVGVFHNSNVLGQWLVFTTLLLLSGVRTLSLPWRWVVAAMVATTLVLTYSRVVWAIAVVVVVVVVLRWANRSMSRVALVAIALPSGGLAALLLGVPAVPRHLLPNRFGFDEAMTQWKERDVLNDLGLSVAGEHTFAGVGYLQFGNAMGSGVLRPHNVFVQVAAEQGLLVVTALILCVFSVTATCWRASRTTQDPWLGGALVLLPVVWVGFLLTYSSAADFAVMPIFVLTLGWLLSRADTARATSTPVESSVVRPHVPLPR